MTHCSVITMERWFLWLCNINTRFLFTLIWILWTENRCIICWNKYVKYSSYWDWLKCNYQRPHCHVWFYIFSRKFRYRRNKWPWISNMYTGCNLHIAFLDICYSNLLFSFILLVFCSVIVPVFSILHSTNIPHPASIDKIFFCSKSFKVCKIKC